VARDWSYAQQSGEGIPLALGMKHALYDKLVYSSIMDVFGGHVEYAVSGGAPLDSSIAHFFNGVGLPLLEGYGMTETCAPSSVNPTVGYKIGTIGLPLQGVTMGVDETGELCIKSPAVCVGYHNHPDVTEQQIVDGWLHTGDLGSIDDDGFVSIVGRKKDLIITAGGKNVSPSEMEASIMTSPVVSQCVVIGDRKPFIASIISLDLAETNLWLESQGAERVENLEEATKNPIVRAEVERAVNKANELVSRAESIRKFEIVPDEFTEGNGLVTPSMKARRQAVVEHYRSLIDTVIYVPKK
jgi:long-chain acyl-CoA synthetase